MKNSQLSQNLYQRAVRIQTILALWMAEISDRFKPFDIKTSQTLEGLSFLETTHMVLLCEGEEEGVVTTENAGLLCDEFEEDYLTRFAGENHFYLIESNAAHLALLKARQIVMRSRLVFFEIGRYSVSNELQELLFEICAEKDRSISCLNRLILQNRHDNDKGASPKREQPFHQTNYAQAIASSYY